MPGTSKISIRVCFRIPVEDFRELERRIAGRRSRWGSVGEYLKERVIYDIERSHNKKKEDK
jgi:hypothetical protein